jgi:hypothetical protein
MHIDAPPPQGGVVSRRPTGAVDVRLHKEKRALRFLSNAAGDQALLPDDGAHPAVLSVTYELDAAGLC